MERDQGRVEREGEGLWFFRRGLELESAGHPVEAIAAYRDAVRICPDLSQAHFSLGVALALQGEPDEAVRALQRAVWLKPEYMNDLTEVLDLDHELRETVVNPGGARSHPRGLSLFALKRGECA